MRHSVAEIARVVRRRLKRLAHKPSELGRRVHTMLLRWWKTGKSVASSLYAPHSSVQRRRVLDEEGGDEQPIEHEMLKEAFLTLAVESWRYGRAGKRLLAKLDESEERRHRRQLRWFQKKVESSLGEIRMRIVNIEGQAFDPGMAATPLNIEDFGAGDTLVVDQMLEPIVMGPGGVVRTGTVTLKKIEQ